MGWTVGFSLIFGIAALIPAVWSIVGVIRGQTRFWPCVIGTIWSVALLLFTFVQIGMNWGGCDSSSVTDPGAVVCADRNGDGPADCKTDVWQVLCKRKSSPGWPPMCGKTPGVCAVPANGKLCPNGRTPVYAFCEPFQLDSNVKQPAATWSDLSFVAAGLWILWFFGFFGQAGGALSALDNPMASIGVLPIVYGFVVIFMGPPSMWFHASMRDWGGWFDSMSVVIWLAFNGSYVFQNLVFAMWDRMRDVKRTIFVLALWGLLIVVLGIVAGVCSNARLAGYFVSGGLWGVCEVIYVIVAAKSDDVKYRRTWWLFVINVSLLAVTMTIWIFFNDSIVSASACQDRESFPGHALFHILASFSTILTFMSFASEKQKSSA